MTMSAVTLALDFLVPMKTDRKRISPADGTNSNREANPS